MIRFVRLTPELLDQVFLYNRRLDAVELFNPASFKDRVLRQEIAVAAIDGGFVIGAGGLVIHWPGRAEGWWLMTSFANRRHLARCTHYSRRQLDRLITNPVYRRVEMIVKASHPWRETFAEALGFEREARMTSWCPDGLDWDLYARISE